MKKFVEVENERDVEVAGYDKEVRNVDIDTTFKFFYFLYFFVVPPFKIKRNICQVKIIYIYIYIYIYIGTTSNPKGDTTTPNISHKLIGSCKNIVYNDNFLENMNSTKNEEKGPPMHEWTF